MKKIEFIINLKINNGKALRSLKWRRKKRNVEFVEKNAIYTF